MTTASKKPSAYKRVSAKAVRLNAILCGAEYAVDDPSYDEVLSGLHELIKKADRRIKSAETNSHHYEGNNILDTPD